MAIYTIRDLAQEFGLTLRALRFYEQRGLLKPTRLPKDKNLRRVYDEQGRARVKEIVDLTRMGFTISEISRGIITKQQYKVQLDFYLSRMHEIEEGVIMLKQRIRDE